MLKIIVIFSENNIKRNFKIEIENMLNILKIFLLKYQIISNFEKKQYYQKKIKNMYFLRKLNYYNAFFITNKILMWHNIIKSNCQYTTSLSINKFVYIYLLLIIHKVWFIYKYK